MNLNRFCFPGVLLLFLLGGALTAVAQDVGSPSFEAYDKFTSESVFFTHGDSTAGSRAVKKDSIAGRAQVKRNV